MPHLGNIPEPLAAALAGRYTLERELGRGGMATVYLAHDLRQDRPVALKVLRPELAAAIGAERFMREIRYAARLQHPHILPVLDSGEAAGQLWYSMPYVEGETLRSRLERERELPVDVAARLAHEIAEGLACAHEHGLVHRDIKPENILLSGGHALVADFGVARAVHGATGEAPLTTSGLAVGTPAYMSPEQVTSERAIDGRADVYSLGCVLYEMLAGEPPFTGPTPQAIIMKRFLGPPSPLGALRPAIPPVLERVVTRALATTPADRFDSIATFAEALLATLGPGALDHERPEPAEPRPRRRGRRVLLAGTLALLPLLAALAVAGLIRWHRAAAAASGSGSGLRIGVLPFDNLGDSATGFFADGITDAVRGKLTAGTGLEVISSSSSGRYRGTRRTPREIGRELGVDYLLVGKVRSMRGTDGGRRVQVAPELIRVATGTDVWQQPFEAAFTDVFQVQTDIAAQVADALGLVLGGHQHEVLAARPTSSLAAYQAYLAGEAASEGMNTRDPTSLLRALGFYERATVLDPRFALAWARLAWAHARIYINFDPDPVRARAAARAAGRAQALAPTDPAVALAVGEYYRFVPGDNTRALAAYETGLRVAPNHVDLLASIGVAEMALGRLDAALRHYTRAAEIDPRSLRTARNLTFLLLYFRRPLDAIAAADRGLAASPDNLELLRFKAMAYVALGDALSARALLRSVRAEMRSAALVSFTSVGDNVEWLLEPDQQAELLALPPSAWGNDRGRWGLALAEIHDLRGERARARAFADSARMALEAQLARAPGDADLHLRHALALAYGGRFTEAIDDGRRGVALQPDPPSGGFVRQAEHLLMRVYLLAGRTQPTLDLLGHLLSRRYYLTPEWLRVDPTFDPLRDNPNFKRLVAGPQ
ncbi:MAG TPA: protein kinase [Gemmatimonadales bacterium]|nr:protein kinase [Gemmatimonadales bacterium]